MLLWMSEKLLSTASVIHAGGVGGGEASLSLSAHSLLTLRDQSRSISDEGGGDGMGGRGWAVIVMYRTAKVLRAFPCHL